MNVKKLTKGDIFKYITQGVNTFSTDEWFNTIIVRNKHLSESKQISNDINFHDVTHLLTSQIISELKNTKYTFKSTFNVLNTYLIAGEEFKKHFDFPWTRPMILIETDLGWYIDSTLKNNDGTKWTLGEHQNCIVSLTKGKYLPYWLEK